MKKACDKPPGGSQDSPLSPFLGRSFITHAEMMGRMDSLRVTGVFAKFRVSMVPALHAFYQRFKRVHQSSCPAPSIPTSIPSPGLLKQEQTVKRHGQGGTLELSQSLVVPSAVEGFSTTSGHLRFRDDGFIEQNSSSMQTGVPGHR